MREDILLDNVNASPKSKHLECTSFMDDSKVSVPLAMEYSETDIDNKGMGQQFYFMQCLSLALLRYTLSHFNC